MKFLEQITEKTKCTEGMSPAEVYKCRLGDQTCYLKTIDSIFSPTTYSVAREAQVMNWLKGKLHVPKVLESGLMTENGERAGNAEPERKEAQNCDSPNREYLLMSELKGRHIDDFADEPLCYVTYLAKAIRELQSVDISDCPFNADVDMRLKELDYLLENGLADTDASHWEETTKFKDPKELRKWLYDHKPQEEFVFTHGDVSANMMICEDEVYFYDLARCGIADKWMDIAFCVRDIRDYCPDLEETFFRILGMKPDYEKIEYYILLDELF